MERRIQLIATGFGTRKPVEQQSSKDSITSRASECPPSPELTPLSVQVRLLSTANSPKNEPAPRVGSPPPKASLGLDEPGCVAENRYGTSERYRAAKPDAVVGSLCVIDSASASSGARFKQYTALERDALARRRHTATAPLVYVVPQYPSTVLQATVPRALDCTSSDSLCDSFANTTGSNMPRKHCAPEAHASEVHGGPTRLGSIQAAEEAAAQLREREAEEAAALRGMQVCGVFVCVCLCVCIKLHIYNINIICILYV
jgi:hypothetical protein